MSDRDKKIAINMVGDKIQKLQDTIELWEKNGLPRHTMIVLLAHYTKLPQKVIRQVLEGIDALYEAYFEDDDE